MRERDYMIPEYRTPLRARDFRRRARKALKGNWWRMALVMLVFSLLSASGSSFSVQIRVPAGRVLPPSSTSAADPGAAGAAGATGATGVADIAKVIGAIDVDPAARAEMSPLETIAHMFRALWQAMPVGMRALLIAAFAVSLALALIYPALRLGLYQAMSALHSRRRRPRVSMLFSQFRHFGKALWLGIVMTFFASLWSLLFVIPGIIAIYRYSMAYYFLWRDPNLRVIDALRKSKAHMRGNKRRVFFLNLSYLGWQYLALAPVVLLVPLVFLLGLQSMTDAGAIAMASGLILYLLIAFLFVSTYMQVGQFELFRHLEKARSKLLPDAEST